MESMELNGEKTILGGDEYVVLRLGDHLTIRFNASERGVYALYIKGFVLMNEWMSGEEHTVKIGREDGLEIMIPIPILEPNQTKIAIDKLVINYET